MYLKVLSLALLVAVVVSVERKLDEGSPATVRIQPSRFKKEGFEVEVKSGGKRHYLSLTKAKSVWSKNARIVTRSEDGEFVSKNIDQTPDNIYHDIRKGSVVCVDGNKIDGVIDYEFTIRSFGGDHLVYKSDNTNGEGTRDYVEIPENVLNGFSKDSNNTDDYDYFQIPEEHLKGRNDTNDGGDYIEIEVPPKKTRVVTSATVEMFAVVDSGLSSYFSNDAEIKKYLSVFYNAVNRRYATISSPEIKIELVGFYVARTAEDEPFIRANENMIPLSTLYSFSDWVIASNLESHDMAYLHTNRDMYDENYNSNLGGVAWTGGACIKGKTRSYACGVGEDWGAFYRGIHTATHEIGHNLGASHDGSGTSKGCPSDGGYIMDYTYGVFNKFFFSTCSINAMGSFIQTAQCLLQDEGTAMISTDLPGKFYSMDEQCKKFTNEAEAVAANITCNDLCVNLVCSWIKLPYIYTSTLNKYAAEGTECPKEDCSCQNGKCQ